MNRTSSSIKGVLDSVRTQLQILDASIKADEKSVAEFERLVLVNLVPRIPCSLFQQQRCVQQISQVDFMGGHRIS